MRRTLTPEEIDAIFETSRDQAEACVALYRLAFPDWDDIAKIDGFPGVGREAAEYIWKKFMTFDRQHHPDVFNGGLWLNSGFSTLEGEGIGPWELTTDHCAVERRTLSPAPRRTGTPPPAPAGKHNLIIS